MFERIVLKGDCMREIIQKWKAWKKEHPDKDYQYDEIYNFVDGELSRGELVRILDFVETEYYKGCPTEEEYKRTNQLTLHLPIKTEWLDMIAAGIKLEEYREIKPYWTKRLCKKVDDREFLTDYYKDYTHVKFHNYGKSLPVYTDLIKIDVGVGKEEWGAVKGRFYYVITIDNPVQDLPF